MRLISLLVLTLGMSLGCVGELEPIDPAASGGGGSPDGGIGSDPAARAFFDSNVAPLMVANRPLGTCALCHQGVDPLNGPDFLGSSAAATYNTLIAAAPRMVNPDNPAASVLVAKGAHAGDAFCSGAGVPYAECTADEIGLITQWIEMEAGQ